MEHAAFDAFAGLRIPLPNGKVLVTTRPLPFRTAIRWLKQLDAFNGGEAFTTSLLLVLEELPAAVGVEDMAVLEDLTMGEVLDYTVYRFLSQRRTTPAWMQAAVPTSQPESPAPSPG